MSESLKVMERPTKTAWMVLPGDVILRSDDRPFRVTMTEDCTDRGFVRITMHSHGKTVIETFSTNEEVRVRS